MEMAVIGTGHVGLATGICFAQLGHRVVCIDRDDEKINELSAGRLTIYEEGLADLLLQQTAEQRLFFTTSMTAVAAADVVILAVGTAQLPHGESDLKDLEAAVRSFAIYLSGHTYVMTKSTVPIGTNERINKWIAETTTESFDVVSVPAFMREGSAASDTMRPERIVIGASNPNAAEVIAGLHRPLTEQVVQTDWRTAEMIKHACNAFLATRISFMNEMANLCDGVGADIVTVAHAMGLDRRIGSPYLRAGIGYGGACFPNKDANGLLQIAGNVGHGFKLLKAVIEVNKSQREHIRGLLTEELGELAGRRIALWGASFKPHTDDVRCSPSLDIAGDLLNEGAFLHLTDPAGELNFRKHLEHPALSWFSDPLAAAQGTEAVCLITEWPQFASVDLQELARCMKRPVLIDGRNVFQSSQLAGTGIHYVGIGRPNMRGVHS
ncbi:UDP-glucose 6-dehydrogenase TuaD [Paenibacillus plantiphilus]|uniref:UDP-glucose 6-dehydrogenase n=1 Tax=Paenibacillus plantiphilus TaxID=2905650 RepID=A0ABN8GNH5_9BACL|nr:UDP-glucose 6-dehydrogenase TuaD [Paenibacillus plantiphilus]